MHTEEPDNDYMAYGGGVAYGRGGRRWWLTRGVWCVLCVCQCCMWFAYMRGRHPRTELGRCGDVCVYNGSAVRDATCTTASVPRFALGPRTKDSLCVLRPARTKDLLCVSYGTPGRRTCPVSLVRHARTKDLLGLA